MIDVGVTERVNMYGGKEDRPNGGWPPGGKAERIGTCVVCRYSLDGHTGEFRCPECGMAYDGCSRVWYSQYTAWHLRSRGPARLLLGAFVVLYYCASFFTNNSAPYLAVLLVLLVAIVTGMRIRYEGRGWKPYVAVMPQGLVIGRNGRPHDSEVLTWGEVRSRVIGEKPRWRWGADIVREIGVNLDITSGRQLLERIKVHLDDEQDPSE